MLWSHLVKGGRGLSDALAKFSYLKKYFLLLSLYNWATQLVLSHHIDDGGRCCLSGYVHGMAHYILCGSGDKTQVGVIIMCQMPPKHAYC